MNYGFTPVDTAASITVDFPTLKVPNFSNVNYIITLTPFGFAPRFSVAVGATFVSGFTIVNSTNVPGTGYYWTALGKPA